MISTAEKVVVIQNVLVIAPAASFANCTHGKNGIFKKLAKNPSGSMLHGPGQIASLKRFLQVGI